MRRVALVVLVILVVAACGVWVRARVAETCPPVGLATRLADPTMTGDGAWRFADVAVGSRHYSLEPQVMADYGAYVRPFPWPESHRVGVSVTVGSTTEDAVRAWRTTCLRVVHRDEAVERPAVMDRDVLMRGDGLRYRFDGAGGYPEWPPADLVDVEMTVVVDGAPFVIRLPGVPIVPVL